MKRLVYTLFWAALIAGCAATSKVSEESPTSENSEAPVQNITEASLGGQQLFVQNCGSCHLLHQPAEYSKQKWEEILPVMIKKAKLGESERDLIHQYIFTEIEK